MFFMKRNPLVIWQKCQTSLDATRVVYLWWQVAFHTFLTCGLASVQWNKGDMQWDLAALPEGAELKHREPLEA